MIKKCSAQMGEVRKNMRGGVGEIAIQHYFDKDEIHARCRLCAQLTIPPGASIGLHEHSSEDEIFIIQQGRGIVVDQGKEIEVHAGDAMVTGRGECHAIRNVGQENLLVTAIIMPYE